jgi:hypothetical protein
MFIGAETMPAPIYIGVKMTWDEIRNLHPQAWVVVEAIDAFTQNGQRIISQLEFVAAFGSNWTLAWENYKNLHHIDKNREYYVVHTEREKLDIGVIDWFGRILNPTR